MSILELNSFYFIFRVQSRVIQCIETRESLSRTDVLILSLTILFGLQDDSIVKSMLYKQIIYKQYSLKNNLY